MNLSVFFLLAKIIIQKNINNKHNTSVKKMRQLKVTKSSQKKKRLSESKPISGYQYKFIPYEPHNHSHNRSQSIGNKKHPTRFHTDYEDHEYRPSQDKGYRKTYYSKKRNETQSFAYKHSQPEGGVQSTKSNPRKNLELRVLFNKTKQSDQIKNKSKGHTAHHPLLKYVSNKNKQYAPSPYTSQIQRFQSLYAKMKNSTSKTKRAPSNQQKNTRDLNLSLKKNQIKIDPKQNGQKQQTHQQTVKTIKKVNKQTEVKQHTSKSKHSQRSQDQLQQEGFGLTQEQQQTFGNRFPYGFQKIKLLGRGGFSLVWLGRHIKSGKQFAIKQIITQNTHQTHIKQIWFGTNFFTLGGIPKPQFAVHPGIKNLVRMYSYEINQSDTWIFYQKCGNSLGSNLYDIKAQRVYGQQRLYKIFYKPFYQAMSQDKNLLKSLIIQICKPLAVLSSCQIVHSDLKTQNILIKYDLDGSANRYKLVQVKLIDYGSSFQFKNISQFSMATPQYMPPQILNYIIHENQGQYEQDLYEQVMTNYKNPWIVDIFSLGCVLLEIVVGVPLWMSLPLLVPSKTGTSYCQKQGLFAVKGRLFPQIIQKQRKVIARIDQVLSNQNYSKISLSPATREVIKGMLCIDFNQRISPTKAIELLQAQKDI